jgi:transketolase
MNGLMDLKKAKLESTRDGFGKGLLEAGKDPKVFALSADLSESTRCHWFKEKFPERYVECGVSEQNMTGVAAGLALSGKIPFACSFAVFSPGLNVAQIRLSVCQNNANVKLVGSHSGLSVGKDGASHQALEDIAVTRSLPGMTVVVPCDAYEAKRAVSELMGIKGPFYLRTSRADSPVITTGRTGFKIGQAEIFRKGGDITIIACGMMVAKALEAAAKLEKKKVEARVINCHTIKPLDKKTIVQAAKETGAILTVEEHNVIGGLGSAVSELLSQNHPVPMRIMGIEDQFGESGSVEELFKEHGLTSDDIVDNVLELIKKK